MENKYIEPNNQTLLSPLNSDLPEINNSFFFGKIILNPGINKLNYIASLFHFIMMTFTFVSFDTLQPMLFHSVHYFNIPSNEMGSENAKILIIDIIVKIICAPIFGILTDVLGRKLILFYGYLSMSIAISLMSFPNEIYPYFCLIRILFAQGTMAITTSPLLADYITDQHKGRGAAINVIMASLGAVISAFLIQNFLSNHMNLKLACISVSIIIFVLGFSYTSFLKGGHYYKEKNQIKKREGLKKIIMVGIHAASENKWILLGYITAFLGRSNSIILTLFLVMWVKDFYPGSDDDTESTANIQAQTLSGIAYTLVLIFAIIYGILIEKINKYCVLGISLIFTALGMNMLAICDDPKSILTYFTMAIVGIGMSGLDTLSLYLVNAFAWKEHRGNINGMSALCGVLGILLICLLGGFLFDAWDRMAPFILFEIFVVIGFLSILYIYFQGRKSKDKN